MLIYLIGICLLIVNLYLDFRKIPKSNRKSSTIQEDIDIKQLFKHYGSHLVLKNISLNIKKGEILTILGPNGAGKTTLISVLLGMKEYRGEISIFGQNIKGGIDR